MSFKTAKKPILLSRGRNRAKRPKTFSSPEAAKLYADSNKIKNYSLKDLTPYSKYKKFRIMVQG